MSDLGSRLRAAREAAGLSLSGMASRTGYSDGYLGNVENGVRNLTPKIIRAYEQVLGVDRRTLLIGIASTAAAAAMPDVAVDVFRDIAAERVGLLSSVQTSHATDKAIGTLVARDAPAVASLVKWSKRGPAVLRVNSVGILAKVGSPLLDDNVVTALKTDSEVRQLYLTAVCARVLAIPWDQAQHATQAAPAAEPDLAAFARELTNTTDSGARMCSLLMLAQSRDHDPATVDTALQQALGNEPSRELLRCLGGVLAGLDPLTV